MLLPAREASELMFSILHFIFLSLNYYFCLSNIKECRQFLYKMSCIQLYSYYYYPFFLFFWANHILTCNYNTL